MADDSMLDSGVSDSSGAFSFSLATGGQALAVYARAEAAGYVTTYVFPSYALWKDQRALSVWMLSVADRAGIVAGLCRVIADSGVNICELTTRSCPGPGGSPHYELAIVAEVPENADVRALREALGEVADRLVIDVALLRA